MVKSSETERKERMDASSLMEQILSSDNLNRAYLQVVRNKGAEGVDGMKYTELKEHLAKNGENIKEQLRTRKYKPQPVRRVEIPKPDGGVRNLGVPTVTDRFIQQAIAQVLTPIYEEQFHDHSYGFRPNRCAQQAILTALDMMNEGNDWIVDIDLEKFFDRGFLRLRMDQYAWWWTGALRWFQFHELRFGVCRNQSATQQLP